MNQKLKIIIIGLLFIAFGAVAILIAKTQIAKGNKTKSWPTAKGIIISSKVGRGRIRAGEPITYAPSISYEYTVNGKKYTSNRVKFGLASYSSNYKEVRRIVERYPANKKVLVYYNPDQIQMAVLETGGSGDVYILLSFGIIFALVGIVSTGTAIVKP